MRCVAFKFKIALLIFFVFAVVLNLCSFGFTSEKTYNNNNSLQNLNENQIIENELSDIWEEFLSILPEWVDSDIRQIDGFGGVKELLASIGKMSFGDGFGEKFLSFLAMTVLLCFGERICSDSPEVSQAVGAGIRACFAVPLLICSGELVLNASDAIASGSEFFALLIPIATAVGGITCGASVAYASATGMSLALTFVSLIAVKLLMPITSLIFAVTLISSVDTGGGVSEIGRGLKSFFSFFSGLCTLIILAVVTFNTVIAASSDSIVLRGAKYAISNMLPVVGNVISGALASVSSGIRLLASSIGILSVIAVVGFIGAPLCSLLGIRLCLGACITLSSFSGSSFSVGFLNSLRGALDSLILVVGASGLVYIFEIILLFCGLPRV